MYQQSLQHLWVCHNCIIRELPLLNNKFEELNTTSKILLATTSAQRNKTSTKYTVNDIDI